MTQPTLNRVLIVDVQSQKVVQVFLIFELMSNLMSKFFSLYFGKKKDAISSRVNSIWKKARLHLTTVCLLIPVNSQLAGTESI